MTETLSTDLTPAVERRILAILTTARDKNLRLATAEGCTGGLIAALLTDAGGGAHAFECGFVSYSDEAKIGMLGVDPALIERHGAVSREVARAMAEGALAWSAAHIAFAVTGFAGPSEAGHEGLVHFACAQRGLPLKHREEHFGSIGRGRTRLACVEVAVEMFEEALK